MWIFWMPPPTPPPGGLRTPPPHTSRVKLYRYIFWNTTGQNQFVLAGKYALPIRFDSKRSDPQALKSLDSLSDEIIEPSTRGGIFLEGELSSKPEPMPTWDKIPNAADPPGS